MSAYGLWPVAYWSTLHYLYSYTLKISVVRNLSVSPLDTHREGGEFTLLSDFILINAHHSTPTVLIAADRH